LLNALAGRASYGNVSGSVTFGKRPMVPADLMYVPQFDEILMVLTVEEQLMLIGELKCVDRKAMMRRLPPLMRILGLYGKRCVRCSQLTGGELKRVSVGMGMVVSPNVLFLDEPTTGLDSSAAFSMVDYIVQVAQKTGVVVIMTIHQPSAMVFSMLQDLLLLEKGRMAFCGSSKHAMEYFESLGFPCPPNANPADYFLELISASPTDPEGPSEHKNLFVTDTTWKVIFGKMRPASVSRAEVVVDSSVYVAPRTSFISQFKTQCFFFMKYYSRESGFYVYRSIFLIVVALFVGTMFIRLKPTTDNVSKYAGALFFAVWAVLFSAIGATGLTASNRLVAINQIQNGIIRPAVYVLAQFLCSLPFNMACAVIFQCILHWLVDMNPRAEPFFYAVLITWGHLIYMEAIMAVVVQVLHDAMLSVIFSMICLGTLFLFPGFFVQVSDIPPWVSWMSYIIGTKYSFDGYLYQVFHSETFDVSGFPGITLTGDQILKSAFGNEDVDSWAMFAVLLAWMIFFRLVHFALFRFEVRYFIGNTQMHQTALPAAGKKVHLEPGTD
jgi:ABC-type multidrug transport system ATPase subunit